jgi:hypothetical protein
MQDQEAPKQWWSKHLQITNADVCCLGTPVWLCRGREAGSINFNQLANPLGEFCTSQDQKDALLLHSSTNRPYVCWAQGTSTSKNAALAFQSHWGMAHTLSYGRPDIYL